MLRLVGFLVRTIIRLKVIAVSVALGMGLAYGLQARAESRTWGLDPRDRERELPGDDLVAAPDHVETRSLVVDALPGSVWPLLMNMGYGRGGWYSYPILDRAWRTMGPPSRAATTRGTPPSETLAEGDLVPTQPGGGLVARVVDPERALVLFLDQEVLRGQFEQQVGDGSDEASEMLEKMGDMPAFGVSWAFVLEPESGGRTRLIERVRLHVDVSGGQKKAMPFIGLGLFAGIRRQMLGIKRRVETGAG
jgi:hypothetical protein